MVAARTAMKLGIGAAAFGVASALLVLGVEKARDASDRAT
jgi:hypothetical protein